jgi:hypothetical protein
VAESELPDSSNTVAGVKRVKSLLTIIKIGSL